MSRIPLLSEDSDLDAEQRRVVDAITSKRGGRIPAPYRLSLHCPALTAAFHPLGETLRLKSTFPLRLTELAILTTARAWDCDYVFHAHSPHALKGGIAQTAIDAIARDARPQLADDERVIYDYCNELIRRHAVSDATHAAVVQLFGVPGAVELTGLIGYYSMVAMMLLAHEMPLPPGVEPPLAKPQGD